MTGPDDNRLKAPPMAEGAEADRIFPHERPDPERADTDPGIDLRQFGVTDFGEEAEAALDSADPAKMFKMRKEFLELKSPHSPRPGGCTYLIVDLASIRGSLIEESTLKPLLSEARLVLKAQGYHVETDLPKYRLTILGTAERSENSMLSIAQSLRSQLPTARIFLGSGEITPLDHTEATINADIGKFIVYEIPTDQTMDEWRALPAGVYLTSILDYDIKDPKSRKGSHCHIETSPAKTSDDAPNFPGLVRLDKYEPIPTLTSGGPDKLIGYDEELKSLDQYMRDDETRLITLQGKAGMGKSRILSTALQNMPSAVVCSVDAADKNLAGSSLVTIADQLAYILGHDERIPIQQFSQRPRAEKITLAQNNPKELFDMCIGALVLLNIDRGEKTVFVLEDIHFADRHSEPWITRMVSEYLRTCNEGKALFTMRPEEMYRSDAQKRITEMVGGSYGSQSTKTLNLGGLDFSNPRVSEEFAFHSIPKEKRQTRSGAPKRLGLWHEKVGKRALNSPFRMKTFMDTLIQEDGLIIGEEVIEAKQEIIDRIEQIEEDGDLATHYRERIERLGEKSKLALQFIGLIGGKITWQQLTVLLSAHILDVRGDAFAGVVRDLEEGGYICLVPGQPRNHEVYTLQHESIRKAVIDSIPARLRKTQATFFYQTLRQSEELFHPDSQFELLNFVATDIDTEAKDKAVWKSYERVVSSMLKDANDRNSSSKAYAVAEAILSLDRGVPVIKKCLAEMKAGTEIPDKIQSIILQILQAKAQSAVYLGKAAEAKEAIADLKAINARTPDLVDMGKIHLIEFEVSYIADEPGRETNESITALFNRHIAPEAVNLSQAEKIIAQIKLMAKLGRDEEAMRLFEEHKPILEELNAQHKKSTLYATPHPSYMEARRLAEVRCPFELVRKAITDVGGGKTLDEDVMLHSGAITEPQAAKLREIQATIAEFMKTKEKHPLVFNPYAEMGLLGIHGQIEAYLGDLIKGREGLSEAWRQSDQSEVPRQGVRYAKMEGDITVIQALSSENKEEKIRLLKEAHGIYSGKCMVSLAQVGEGDFYQAAIRIQRIRVAGRLLLTYDLKSQPKPIPMKTKRELWPYIEQAAKDFDHVNTMYGNRVTYLMEHPEDRKNPDETIRKRYNGIKAWVAEIGYYMTGYVGHIVSLTKELGIGVPPSLLDAERNPFANTALIGDALACASKKSDKGFGDEVRTKFEGLTSRIID